MMDSTSKDSFNGDYVAYWQQRVATAVDGSKVADADILDYYVKRMGIGPGDRVLDLGCGFGRFFPMLARYTPRVLGIDVCEEMLQAASSYPYDCLIKASAEETRLPRSYVDRIILFGTFDVTDQETVLLEANRILRPGGMLLVTGKNLRYREDDRMAFIAERNAKIKGFPNHFTDLSPLFSTGETFGFRMVLAYAFERRGDLGENRFSTLTSETVARPFYEYLLIMAKSGEPAAIRPAVAGEFSATAAEFARRQGFGDDLFAFFNWHKSKHGE